MGARIGGGASWFDWGGGANERAGGGHCRPTMYVKKRPGPYPYVVHQSVLG